MKKGSEQDFTTPLHLLPSAPLARPLYLNDNDPEVPATEFSFAVYDCKKRTAERRCGYLCDSVQRCTRNCLCVVFSVSFLYKTKPFGKRRRDMKHIISENLSKSEVKNKNVTGSNGEEFYH